MARQAQVPTFYLYGEPHRSAAYDLVHVESLDHRSRPANWTIRPHAHRDLNHLILIARGGGVFHADEAIMRFEAPCLLLVPSGVVHGFRWHEDSEGHVVTLANGYRQELVRRDRDVGRIFAQAAVAPLTPERAEQVAERCQELVRELGWNAPGHRTAVEAALGFILLEAMRCLARQGAVAGTGGGREAELVARFRQLIEDRFREREPVARYCERLGVSATTLGAACARTAGSSPAEMVNARCFLEAKRALCYTNQTVSEIAYSLGFVDPAYFTRAFTKRTGQSPRQFRLGHQARTAGGERAA